MCNRAVLRTALSSVHSRYITLDRQTICAQYGLLLFHAVYLHYTVLFIYRAFYISSTRVRKVVQRLFNPENTPALNNSNYKTLPSAATASSVLYSQPLCSQPSCSINHITRTVSSYFVLSPPPLSPLVWANFQFYSRPYQKVTACTEVEQFLYKIWSYKIDSYFYINAGIKII